MHSRWAPSNGLLVDLKSYNAKYFSARFSSEEKLIERSLGSIHIEREFKSFHHSTLHDPDARLLKLGFSRGADDIRDALSHCPQEVRNKIKVRLFGPAVCISQSLCPDIRHYISKDDMIPRLPVRGLVSLIHARQEWTVADVPSIKGALIKGIPYTDHRFMSPTYMKWWLDEIEDFKTNYNVR